MVEPIFRRDDLRLTQGTPTVYQHRSEGSGKAVFLHFCPTCGTKLYLTFERFADSCGVYAGTFDDPNWFEIVPETSKHIFVGVARHDTILPAGVPLFGEHAKLNDDTPVEPITIDAPRTVESVQARFQPHPP
jgi:hypothetical protein